MKVRRYTPDDATGLARLRYRSIYGLATGIYSDEQFAVWLPQIETDDQLRRRCEDGRSVWVAMRDSGDIAGSIDMEADGHIDFLYVDPDFGRQALRLCLIEIAENQARADQIIRLYTEASDLARPVFAKAGFIWLYRREFDLRGTMIHSHAMEKAL